MNMNEWVKGILASNKTPALPLLTSCGFELIGNSILDGVSDGSVQARAIIELHDTYPSIACPMVMDLSVEAEAFGARIRFTDKEIPVVLRPLLETTDSIADLEIPGLDRGRLPEFLKAARLSVEAITDRPVFGVCIGPYSLAGRLLGMTEIMTEMMINPESIRLLVGKCASFLMSYILEFKRMGVQGILIAEPAAGLLSPDSCDEYSSALIRNIVAAAQDDYFMVVLHNCGNTGILNKSMLSTGARALHFGNRNNIVETLKQIPSDILVLGNIDPVNIMRYSTPGIIIKEIKQLLESARNYRNFILSSGCDIPPGTPKANIGAFYEAVS
jgi:uroporphyrinogen decarboxylase